MKKGDLIARRIGWAVTFGVLCLFHLESSFSQNVDDAGFADQPPTPEIADDRASVPQDTGTPTNPENTRDSSGDRDREHPASDNGTVDSLQFDPVVVTGSHIRRSEIEGPQPIDVITPDLIERVGGVKLGDYLQYLTINSFSADAGGNILNERAGVSHFNLRGFGADATLTLINGHRVAPYGDNGTEGFVNIDAIPLAAIDRVEILKDGASAIYGADAVAGVVNIILKDHYEGLDLSASYLETEDGGGNESAVDMIGGKTFGKTNVTAVFGWYDLDPIYSRQRDITANADTSWRGGYDHRNRYGSPPSAWLIADDQQGRPPLAPDPECPPDSQRVVIPGSFEECAFNWAAQSMATVGTERYSGLLFVTHEVSPTLTLRAQAGYDRYDVDRVLASQPVSGFAAALPTYTGNPYVPAEHPDNPFGQNVEITYRMTDFPPRDISTKTTGRRALLELEWLRDAWRWRGHAAWSDSRSDYDTKNRVRMDRFQDALLGQGGPGGDQWFNPFGLNPDNDPVLVDWIRASTKNKLDTRERALGVTADGELLRLPAGPLGFAFGAEYRDQNVWQTPDPLDLQGVIAELEFLPVSEDRNVRAAFAELSIPVLDTVEVQIAGRLEDYSDFGSEFSPKYAVAWRPTDTLLIRGSYSESFLPPNFRELYDPQTQYTEELVDSVRCPITSDPQDCDGDFYPVTYGGNPDLDPETAESWYAGLIWSPGVLEGLDLELGYWSFKFDDRIGNAWAQFVVNSAGEDSSLVTRLDPTPEDEALGAPGRIERVNDTYLNLGKDETSGIDFAARYEFVPKRLGNFTAATYGTYVDEMKVTLPPAFDFWEYNGENISGTSQYWGTGQPEWRVVSSLEWQLDNTSASVVRTWYDSYEDYRNYPADNNRFQSDRKHTVSSWTSWDFQVSQVFPMLMDGRLSVGCANCFDEEPPLYFGYAGSANGVDLGLHDLRGRSLYARWAQPFGGRRPD